MRTIREILSLNIRELRGKRSMAAIAEAADIPFRTYQTIDMGQTWPHQGNLEAIAKALGVTPARLFQDPTLSHSPQEVLAIVASALQSRRESPTPASDNPDLARVAAALETEAGRMLIMDVVEEVEKSQRKKASKSGSQSA